MLYKNAVGGGLNSGVLPHMLQQQRQATHSPDENRAPIFASNVSLTGPGACCADVLCSLHEFAHLW